MVDSFTIPQNLKLSEVISIFYFQMVRMKIVRRIFIFGMILGVISAFMDLAFIKPGPYHWLILIAKLLIAPVFLFTFFSVLLCILSILMYKLKPSLFKNITYRYTNWGIERVGKGLEFSAQWNKISKLTETRNFIFLYLDENNTHVIQKRMLTTGEELKHIREFISQKLHSK